MVHHSILIHETDTHGTFEEFLLDDDDSEFLFLAPHGGQVEPNTDTEALILKSYVEHATVWGTRGITNDGYNGAYNRWHTTGNTHPLHMFPLYQNILQKEFTCSVSLHVMSEDGVIVGGNAPEDCKKSLVNHLQKVFPGKDIRMGVKGEPLAGTNPKNFVNNSNTKNPIHIEQSKDIAMNHPNRFSRCLAEWVKNTDFSGFE